MGHTCTLKSQPLLGSTKSEYAIRITVLKMGAILLQSLITHSIIFGQSESLLNIHGTHVANEAENLREKRSMGLCCRL